MLEPDGTGAYIDATEARPHDIDTIDRSEKNMMFIYAEARDNLIQMVRTFVL